MKLFKICLLCLLMIFASSGFAEIKPDILIEWKCSFCRWQWYGNNPPHAQKCYGIKNGCHVWVIENIFFFDEKDK